MSTRRRKVVRSRQNQDENKRKKRLLVALLMLILTGVALTTATYAWFSSNTVVDTTDIDLKVTAATGISISADALNFKKTISMNEVISFARIGCETGGVNSTGGCPSRLQYPDKLNPVSTVGANGSSVDFYTASIGDYPNDAVGYLAKLEGKSTETHALNVGSSGCTSTNSCEHTGGDYVAFDFWLRSGADYNLDIDAASVKLSTTDHGTTTSALESGLRILFVNLGNQPDATVGQNELYALNDTTDDNWTIYNPYPKLHHSTSLTSSYHNLPGGAVGEGVTSDDGEYQYGYYAVKNIPTPLPTPKYGKDGDLDNTAGSLLPFTYYYLNAHPTAYDSVFELINKSNSHYLVGGGHPGQTQTGDLSTGKTVLAIKSGVTRVRCYIYLEGQDIDTVDAISFSKGFYFNFGFKISSGG